MEAGCYIADRGELYSTDQVLVQTNKGILSQLKSRMYTEKVVFKIIILNNMS